MTPRHYDWLSHHAMATPEKTCWVDLHSGRSFTFAAAEDRWGEVGVAFIVAKTDAGLTEADVIAHCQGRIARYKTPARVIFVEEFPRNATGKVLRPALRDRL